MQNSPSQAKISILGILSVEQFELAKNPFEIFLTTPIARHERPWTPTNNRSTVGVNLGD
jgi:hypothetical protein